LSIPLLLFIFAFKLPLSSNQKPFNLPK